MFYGSSEFGSREGKLLCSTDQYIFLSPSRVYADSKGPITEESLRLLDVCKDEEYLRTDEYALANAREENLLFGCRWKNWTIFRPYITYNVERLQLGGLEKDTWLRRALEERSIPLTKDIAECQTTLTYGGDVASAIAALIGNGRAVGQIFNLTGTEHMAWADVLNIYLDVMEKETGTRPKIYEPENSKELYERAGNKHQIIYDRLYDRIFDNSKLMKATEEKLKFCSMREGLTKCITKFISNPRWREDSPKLEAYLNRELKEGSHPECFTGKKARIKYLGWYYAPTVMETLKK